VRSSLGYDVEYDNDALMEMLREWSSGIPRPRPTKPSYGSWEKKKPSG